MSNNRHLSASEIIEKRCARVGSEDLKTAALKLRYAEHGGYKGPDLLTANNIAIGMELAVAMSARGDHESATKQAGSCLYALKKNRVISTTQNRKSLGSMIIECRDGTKRKLGDIIEWYIDVHSRIHQQISAAKAAEKKEKEEREAAILAEEMELIEFSASVAAGKAA